MLTAVFAGVSTVLVSDGSSAVLVDGFFSRPPLRRLLTRVAPDHERIRWALDRLRVDRLDAVLVSHSHVDHVLDAPVVADLTGAVLAGSPSTRQVQIGYGLGDRPFADLVDGEPLRAGAFTVTPIRAEHSAGDRAPGEITAPVVPPARAKDYRTGGCWSFHIAHPAGRVLVHGSAGAVPDGLEGYLAELLYLGIGAIGRKREEWREDYWAATAGAVGARVVRPVHWDRFWRPLDGPVKRLPSIVDRVDVSLETMARLAARTDVDLALPRVLESEQVPRPGRE
ncbi:MBL fold metallo-hydrolase [Nakamurella sp. YIM 132087]|uniref:MBL fold metallo-hydrolase n=1 Tax=Nakamurella alba TaxID=2665158 RepID=A0A7K1FLI5_9ACTN|nr:MBL fold metallo-hydrolase [Nakamurella alba]MTD13744.1 MBL fold metallo-hydrolase [Nakamurella alba]